MKKKKKHNNIDGNGEKKSNKYTRNETDIDYTMYIYMCKGKNESREKGKHFDEIDLHISILGNQIHLDYGNKTSYQYAYAGPFSCQYKRYACATDAPNSSNQTEFIVCRNNNVNSFVKRAASSRLTNVCQ